MRFAAIIVAAGHGVRFGRQKQLAEIAGRPLVAWSLGTFGDMPELRDLVIATEEEHRAELRSLAERYASRLRAVVVAGGATRQESVRRALAAVPPECDAALVHDGARPLVRAGDVRSVMALVAPGAGAIVAEPVTDTIKLVARGSRSVVRTLDRAELWAAQTPQGGTLADLRRAHAGALDAGVDATDDAMLLERIGCTVEIVPAGAPNFKVTQPADAVLAEAILLERAAAPRTR